VRERPPLASLTGLERQAERMVADVLSADPMLSFVAQKVIPLTAYRPPLAVYPQVSVALQEATAAVVAGKSPADAAAEYQKKVEGLVGGAANVSS